MMKPANLLILIILLATIVSCSYEKENAEVETGLNLKEEQNDGSTGIMTVDRVSVIENARLYKDPPEIKVPQDKMEKRYTEYPRWTFVQFVRTSSDGYTELVITADGEERLANKEEWLPAYRVEPREGDSVELLPDENAPPDSGEKPAPVLKRGEIVAVFPIEGPDGTVKVTDENGSTGFVIRNDLTPLGDERE